MAGVHRDLEELQTSYSAFGNRNDLDPGEDDDLPPRFQQSHHNAGTFWANQDSPLPGGRHSKHIRDHGDHDPPPGGVIIHTVPEESKSRWSHIDDLDNFFQNVYAYHQKSGFRVMIVQVRLNTRECVEKEKCNPFFISEIFRALASHVHPLFFCVFV